jgi:fumarate hydratase class II
VHQQQRTEGSVEHSLAMGTAPTGEIGYETAALLVNEAHPTAVQFATWRAKNQGFRKSI